MKSSSRRLQLNSYSLFILSFFLIYSLSVISVIAGEPPESIHSKDISHKDDNGGDEANGAGVIFEEPLVNGKPLSLSLPEPDDCLEPGDREVLPMVAIIIDDMGHHKKMGGELLNLELNLTFSFLPYAPFTAAQGELAWKMGRDILVHMPMEPRDPSFDPGPGTLYIEDSAESIARKVEKNIGQVPYAVGVNNHMGSKFTSDREAMHGVMSVLKDKGLFFIDSLTTSKSVGANEARMMDIRTGRRSIFLDNSQTQEDICRQLKRLVAYAKKHGSGIGIGHPNRATINALKSCKDLLLKQVRIVGVRELIK